MKHLFFYALLLASLTWQCETSSSDTLPNLPVTADMEQVAEMNQTLGWDLFHEEQQAAPQENILISPFSVQTALFHGAERRAGQHPKSNAGPHEWQ